MTYIEIPKEDKIDKDMDIEVYHQNMDKSQDDNNPSDPPLTVDGKVASIGESESNKKRRRKVSTDSNHNISGDLSGIVMNSDVPGIVDTGYSSLPLSSSTLRTLNVHSQRGALLGLHDVIYDYLVIHLHVHIYKYIFF